MRSLLGMLMALAVSAGKEVNITRTAGENVTLPCDCTDRNMSEDFYWQMESNGNDVIVIDQSGAHGSYKGRAEIFVNCSLRLFIINTKDTGKYKCIFYIGARYNPVCINLNVTDFINLNGTDFINLTMSSSKGESYQGPPHGRIRFLKIVPIVLLLGFCLVLWCHRQRVSH